LSFASLGSYRHGTLQNFPLGAEFDIPIIRSYAISKSAGKGKWMGNDIAHYYKEGEQMGGDYIGDVVSRTGAVVIVKAIEMVHKNDEIAEEEEVVVVVANTTGVNNTK